MPDRPTFTGGVAPARVVDVVTGLVAGGVLFVAVPVVLAIAVGLPLPRHWTGHDVLSSHGALDLLAVAAWLAWASCCRLMLSSIAVRVRSGNAGDAGATFPDWLATRIAASILVLLPVGLAIGVPAGAAGPGGRALRPPATIAGVRGTGGRGATVVAQAPPPATAEAGAGGAPAPPAAGPAPSTYTVGAGDSLWSIAERFYPDGGDWSLIARANLGHVMADGTIFTDPALIRPGWVLTLPALHTTPAPTTPAPTTPASSTPAPTTPAHSTTPAPRPVGRGGTRSSRDARRPSPPPGPGPVPLPELAALGVGTLVAAGLARRARRARTLTPRS
ncbi:MAG: LysM peptidoglycan-binding domain-containing protein, partial [Acidimicrobiales bacterium]